MPKNKEQLKNKVARRVNIGSMGLICAALSLAATAGFLLGRSRQGESLVLAVQQRVPFEFYLDEASFSEIENTKARLEALSVQYLTELRLRHDGSTLKTAASTGTNPSYAVGRQSAREELQRGIQQFLGTGPELHLVQELLLLLKREQLADRWMDVYLGALYRHPMEDLIGRNAKDAVMISHALGRQEDLRNAFDVLRRIPGQFFAKEQALAALGEESVEPIPFRLAVDLTSHQPPGLIPQVRQ